MFIELPYPPSVNAYYRPVNNRLVITRIGKKYRERVRAAIRDAGCLPGRVTAIAEFYPPDNRTRDVDNLFKAYFDAVKNALIEDDSKVKIVLAYFGDPVPPNGLCGLRLFPFAREQFDRAARAICS